MSDTVSKERRSEIMSHIKSKNTSIELKVRQRLYALGYRYRKNYNELLGKPDIVFIKKRIVVFIHGCFWHGHEIGCRYAHIPKSRQDYWNNKILKTKKRDKEHVKTLVNDGWNVITIWECEIKTNFDSTINRLINFIEKSESR